MEDVGRATSGKQDSGNNSISRWHFQDSYGIFGIWSFCYTFEATAFQVRGADKPNYSCFPNLV